MTSLNPTFHLVNSTAFPFFPQAALLTNLRLGVSIPGVQSEEGIPVMISAQRSLQCRKISPLPSGFLASELSVCVQISLSLPTYEKGYSPILALA